MLNLLDATADEVRAAAPGNSVLVSPTHVTLAGEATHIITVAGYPTGRHHSLVKAAEARLAVQSGAAEVWVSVDETIEDPNQILAELAAIRESCPEPVQLGLIAAPAALKPAEQAGFNKIISFGDNAVDTTLPVVRIADCPSPAAERSPR